MNGGLRMRIHMTILRTYLQSLCLQGRNATALLGSSSIGLAVYAEACISLVFGVPGGVCCCGFGTSTEFVGLCVCRRSHTDNFCFK
jgi:hypothetical protein